MRHSNVWGAYGHPHSLKKHAFFMLCMYSGHPKIWGYPNIQGASKHMGATKYTGGHTNI